MPETPPRFAVGDPVRVTAGIYRSREGVVTEFLFRGCWLVEIGSPSSGKAPYHCHRNHMESIPPAAPILDPREPSIDAEHPPLATPEPTRAWRVRDRVRLTIAVTPRHPRGSTGRVVRRLDHPTVSLPDHYLLDMDEGGDVVAHASALEPGPPAEMPGPGPAPGEHAVADVARGAALWQMAAPMERVVHVAIRGHVATVTAATSPFSPTHEVKFLRPFRPEAVAFFLDGATRPGSPGSVVISGEGPASAAAKVIEDDGEID